MPRLADSLSAGILINIAAVASTFTRYVWGGKEGAVVGHSNASSSCMGLAAFRSQDHIGPAESQLLKLIVGIRRLLPYPKFKPA